MTDVFNSETPVVPVTPADPVVEKRLQDKDAFIEQLKREQAELREELKKRVIADDQLNELRAEITALKEQTTQPREHTSPALSESSIRALVEQTITNTERNRATGVNIQEANTALIKHFGGDATKAADHVQAKAKELGVKVDFLKDMAAQSPTGFLTLMGTTATAPVVDTNIRREVRSENREISPGVGLREGTYEWFEDIRRKSATQYWTPNVQQQLFKAVQDGTYKRPAA